MTDTIDNWTPPSPEGLDGITNVKITAEGDEGFLVKAKVNGKPAQVHIGYGEEDRINVRAYLTSRAIADRLIASTPKN